MEPLILGVVGASGLLAAMVLLLVGLAHLNGGARVDRRFKTGFKNNVPPDEKIIVQGYRLMKIAGLVGVCGFGCCVACGGTCSSRPGETHVRPRHEPAAATPDIGAALIEPPHPHRHHNKPAHKAHPTRKATPEQPSPEAAPAAPPAPTETWREQAPEPGGPIMDPYQ